MAPNTLAEYHAATEMMDLALEKYETACSAFTELHDAVIRADHEVSLADVELEYANLHGLDTTEPENKFNSAKQTLQDAKFRMNEMVPREYEAYIHAKLRYKTARIHHYKN